MQHDGNIIGRKVARLRYQKGWTQDVLVARLQVIQCNITRDIIKNIESRRCVATDTQCAFLARVFNVSIDELFRP